MRGIWIRSQDKSVLICTGDLFMIRDGTWDRWEITCSDCGLGKYSTEEKAIKVLDTIQRFMYKYEDSAYQMPLDEEVKV